MTGKVTNSLQQNVSGSPPDFPLLQNSSPSLIPWPAIIGLTFEDVGHKLILLKRKQILPIFEEDYPIAKR